MAYINSQSFPGGKWEPRLRSNLEYLICMTGVRGGGKSLTGAFLAFTECLARGKRLISNIPIGANIFHGGQKYELKSEPLDFDLLFSFDASLKYAWVFIDEANYTIESRRSGSTKNILFGDLVQQIRKRHMTLVFTVQFENWLDYRIRQGMDIVLRCSDRSRLDEDYGKGEWIDLIVEDWSGILTGEPYHWSFEPALELALQAKAAWDIYSTEEYVDIWEARRGVEVTDDKLNITIGRDRAKENLISKYSDRIEYILQDLATQQKTAIPQKELNSLLGITEMKEKQFVGSIMFNRGCTKRNTNGIWNWILPDNRPLVSSTSPKVANSIRGER